MTDTIRNPLFDTLFADKAADSRPFLFLHDDRTVSYADFHALTGRIANALVSNGVVPGDRVAVQVPKSAEALALYAACARAGAVFLPLNTAYTPAEIGYFVGDAEPRLVICDPAAEAALAPIAAETGASLMTLGTAGTGSLADAAETAPASFETIARDKGDLAAILYTSGTTGRSKGAMLTQENLLSNARTLARYWQFSADDVLLHALPIFHTHGLFVATNTIATVGASMIFLPGFKLEPVLDGLKRATAMMGVPTFYTRLLASPEFTRERVAHMRLFVSGSAPLLADTHIAFEERTGHRILERYGMTETNMNTSNPCEGERRAGTVGFPLPGVDVRIADPETGAPVDDGEIGMIEVCGPNVFKGYWRMPEKTKSEFRDDGYFITGDLGRIDPDGYVTIVGRGKDLIISGGYNIYPKEIELAIDAIDGITESAVIGVPHPDFGEGVVGIVVRDEGAAIDESALLQSLGTSLARFKQPKRIFFSEELPRNTMGKVQKAALRDTYATLFTSA
ncbi:MAG: malonyl-CoA synthase [Pseudomonadota bacterium]